MLTEDQIFRLNGADYAAEFHALIPHLQEVHGERFQTATLYYYGDGSVIRICDTTHERIASAPVPLSVSREKVMLQIILGTITYTGKNTYTYFLDRIGLDKWSHPFGRKPIKDWIVGVRAAKFRSEARRRMAPIKEELMAAAWAPERVERLIAAGGLEALD